MKKLHSKVDKKGNITPVWDNGSPIGNAERITGIQYAEFLKRTFAIGKDQERASEDAQDTLKDIQEKSNGYYKCTHDLMQGLTLEHKGMNIEATDIYWQDKDLDRSQQELVMATITAVLNMVNDKSAYQKNEIKKEVKKAS